MKAIIIDGIFCYTIEEFGRLLTKACSDPIYEGLQKEIVLLYEGGKLGTWIDGLDVQERNAPKRYDLSSIPLNAGHTTILRQLSILFGTPFNIEAISRKYSDCIELENTCEVKMDSVTRMLKFDKVLKIVHDDKATVDFTFNVKHVVYEDLPLVFMGQCVNLSLRKSGEVHVSFALPEDNCKETVTCQGEALVTIHKTRNLQFNANGVTFNMVPVRGGTLNVDKDHWGISLFPMHDTTISIEDYYIGETLVTQSLWKAVMGTNPSHFEGDNLPVESVSWEDCQVFIGKLNSLTSNYFRLPTEAEWEYAAMGGRRTRGTKYSGNEDIDLVAWHDTFCTYPVASKQANELGVFDMSGNVSEWCNNLYEYVTAEIVSKANIHMTATPQFKSCRGGGGIYNTARNCAINYRGLNLISTKHFHLGLRLAMTFSEYKTD